MTLDLFPLLRGVQTGVAISVLALTLTLGNAVVRFAFQRHRPEGIELTAAIWLFSVSLLPSFGWLAVQYWVLGLDTPTSPPLYVRLLTGTGLLTAVAWFIALVQPSHISRRQAFMIWSVLIACIVLMSATSG